MNPLDINDPRAEIGDTVVLLINTKTGTVKEIPCGPINAGHLSGDRPVVYNKTRKVPEIPARWADVFMFYRDFCASPDVAKAADLSVEESKAYYKAYRDFMKARGSGKAARVPDGVDIDRLKHPAACAIRDRNKRNAGQESFPRDKFEKIVSRLRSDASAENTKAKTKVKT